MNIVILDDFQDAVRKLACASKLSDLPARVYTNNVKGVAQLSVRLRDAQILVLIGSRTEITAPLLDKLNKLKLIVQVGQVGPHLDVNACSERGIAVACGNSDPYPMAEMTWAAIMTAMRRLPQYIGNLKHGAWQQSGLKSLAMPSNFGLGQRLRGKCLGIWGYGRVGSLVANYAKAFGLNVLVWGGENSLSRAQADGLRCAPSKEILFQQSDILSLHLRHQIENKDIVQAQDLALMKPTSLLVNTASPWLISQDVLVTALNRGRPGMAVLDVFENEPLLQGNALLRLENCICLPHISDVEIEQYEALFSTAFDQIISYVKGTPTGLLNPGVLYGRRS